jgi:hypothetical protein
VARSDWPPAREARDRGYLKKQVSHTAPAARSD